VTTWSRVCSEQWTKQVNAQEKAWQWVKPANEQQATEVQAQAEENSSREWHLAMANAETPTFNLEVDILDLKGV
jgi:hypothetical protein